MPNYHTVLLYNSAGVPIVGSDMLTVPTFERSLPGIGINTASSIQDLFSGSIVRRGQWISRQGLPCASDDLKEEEARHMVTVGPPRCRQPKVRRATKYYAEY